MLEELAEEGGILERSNHDLALAACCTDAIALPLELAGAIKSEQAAADHDPVRARYG